MPKLKSPFPAEAVDSSIQVLSGPGTELGAPFTLYLAGASETITAWGQNVPRRDRELREFYPTNDFLAGAIGAVAMRNASFEWKVEGTPRSVDASTRMLHSAIAGSDFGWMPFIENLTIDLATQDNGCFFELIRTGNEPTSPVVGIGHLEAARCTRTGDIRYPVVYTDEKGNLHKLAWYQVIGITDMPSPQRKMRGAGMCAISRVLKMSTILKDLAVYKGEKIGGRFAGAIHFVGGAKKTDIDDVMAKGDQDADNRGLTHYMMPLILASLDPETPVSHVEIPLKSLPDNFDFDQEMKWYIAGLALGFGGDYQDFAPLPGGNLGTSAQSEILHRKSRGKGPAFFMNRIRDVFTYRGVLLNNVSFTFYEQDLAADKERAQLAQMRAQTRAIQMRSGEINQAIARKLAIRNDDLEEEDITNKLLKEADVIKPQQYIGAGQNNLNSRTLPSDLTRSALRPPSGPDQGTQP